jgi:hypothetical protein
MKLALNTVQRGPEGAQRRPFRKLAVAGKVLAASALAGLIGLCGVCEYKVEKERKERIRTEAQWYTQDSLREAVERRELRLKNELWDDEANFAVAVERLKRADSGRGARKRDSVVRARLNGFKPMHPEARDRRDDSIRLRSAIEAGELLRLREGNLAKLEAITLKTATEGIVLTDADVDATRREKLVQRILYRFGKVKVPDGYSRENDSFAVVELFFQKRILLREGFYVMEGEVKERLQKERRERYKAGMKKDALARGIKLTDKAVDSIMWADLRLRREYEDQLAEEHYKEWGNTGNLPSGRDPRGAGAVVTEPHRAR